MLLYTEVALYFWIKERLTLVLGVAIIIIIYRVGSLEFLGSELSSLLQTCLYLLSALSESGLST